MSEQNETPKRRGRPPWTEEQKQARRELNERKRQEAQKATGADKSTETPAKRPRGRPRMSDEERARRIAESRKNCQFKSRAQIIENARNGIEVSPKKVAHFTTPEDFEESGKALMEVLYEASLPPVYSDEELQQRFVEYFQRCATSNRIPTVEECFLCTGHSFSKLYAWRNLKTRPFWGTENTPQIIAWAVDICRAYDAKMVLAGKLPQVPWIFYAKNHFGMKDKTEIEVTANVSDNKPATLEDIAKRYGFETEFVDGQKEGD